MKQKYDVTLDQVIDAARKEGQRAWDEGWQMPMLKNVATLLGYSVTRNMISKFTPEERAAISKVWDAILEEQTLSMVAEATNMLNEVQALYRKKGEVRKLSRRALYLRLGIGIGKLESSRFQQAKNTVSDIWSGWRVKHGARPGPLPDRCARCDTPSIMAPFVGVFCEDCDQVRREVLRLDNLYSLERQRDRERQRSA